MLGRNAEYSLSEVERRILLNQYKILAALFPAEAEYYDGLAQILGEGYHDRWEDAVLGDMKEPLPEEDTDFVYEVLVMYDWMQKSFYSLSMADRETVDEKRLRFPGFDTVLEKRLGVYARFLIKRVERFTFLSAAPGMNNNTPLRTAYARMLAAAPKLEERNLSAVEIRYILDAATKRPAQAPKLSRSVNSGPVATAPAQAAAGSGTYHVANRPAAGVTTRGSLALKPAPVLPQEVFAPTPELAAFEAALNASLAREAFPYLRE